MATILMLLRRNNPLSLLLTILLGASLIANGQSKSDLEQAGLRGSVQTVKTEITEFTIRDGKNVEGPRLPVQTVDYDARGNRTRRVDFNRDGSVAQTIVYNYDAEGRRTGYEDYLPGLTAARKHIYVLDQTGKRVEYKIVQPTGKAGDEKYLYKYDAGGNLIAEELQHKSSLISRNENTYDAQGRLITQTMYNPDGSVSARLNNSFGADGRPLERVRHDGDLLTYRVSYKYDGKGRLERVETSGSYVETDSSSESYITGQVVYVYKGKDQPKETVIYNPDGSFRERLVLEYDSRGNWTKRTRRVKATNGKDTPAQIEYRTITYR